MKLLRSAVIVLAIGVASISTASARDSFSIGVNIGGYGYAPPVAYYPAPPVVYYSQPVYYRAVSPIYYQPVASYRYYYDGRHDGYRGHGHQSRGHEGHRHHGWGHGNRGRHDGHR